MDESFLKVVSEAGSLNSEIFSLPRLELLASLSELGRDGATCREMKATLGLSDGALYANLKILEKMGYLKKVEAKVEGKELEAYCITDEGEAEWRRVQEWLCKLLVCCGGKKL